MIFKSSLIVALSSGFASAAFPPGHDSFLNKFVGTLRCPYASDWLTKGPEQAARDLGIAHSMNEHQHRLLETEGFPEAGGTPEGVIPGSGPPEGAFTGSGPPEGVIPGGGWGGGAPGGSPPICEIAPGPAGAAHQAAYSSGYRSNCTGTPGEESPYMWPLAWSANIESESMAFGTDEVGFHSRGQVWYRLDRNWKRADTFYQRGVQRSIGQGPCDPENVVSAPDEPVIACSRNSDSRATMLHRGSKMYFITWKNETEGDAPENIDTCRWLDLAIVGNIRPDWYLDNRGEATNVQYIGKQHVYHHNSTPRLVRQWRKEDFADQYFTMSMQENVLDDGIHWPLILNVPGEGFGDDFLQRYTNHFMLSDEDDYLFLLDEALVAINGTCPQMDGGGGASGPPVGEVEPIPSNLVVEPEAFFTNEVTFSPIWKAPAAVDDSVFANSTASSNSAAITLTDFGYVTSCYNIDLETVDLSFTFTDVAADESEELPWIALGYRPTEECLMTPRGGGDTDIVFIGTTDEGTTASIGLLSPEAKRFDSVAFSSLLSGLSPMADAPNYSNYDLTLPFSVRSAKTQTVDESNLQLSFSQAMEKPEVMNLMFAIGNGPDLGYHTTRDCFQITDFPVCSPEGVASSQTDLETSGSTSSRAAIGFSAVVATIAAFLM